MMKLFFLPILFSCISFPQEPSFIVGKWKASTDPQSPTLVLIFHSDHQVEMDYSGDITYGTWHWDSGMDGYRISFMDGAMKLEMENADLRNDTLFFGYNETFSGKCVRKYYREYLVKMK